MLYITGLGSGSWDMITPRALDLMRRAAHVALRTGRINCKAQLEQVCDFITFDELYESAADFDELTRLICDNVAQLAQTGDTVYAVFDVSDATVGALIQYANREDIAYAVIPGVPVCAQATAGLTGEYMVIDALDCELAQINPRIPLIIREIDSRVLAGELKISLMRRYPSDTQVALYLYDDVREKSWNVPLSELDRLQIYSHNLTARIDALPLETLSARVIDGQDADEIRFDFEHLVEIMRVLRSPDGCPWDREQTPQSLRRNLIEESYEAVERIDAQDWDGLYDELGDVLLQVALQSQIADEYGRFDISDVTTAICRKMIYRHSHIFGHDKAENADEVTRLWEERKRAEKGERTTSRAMRDVALALPELMRAEKVLSKALRSGFGWTSAVDSLQKVVEETAEVREALNSGDANSAEGELGDLLLAAANVCVTAQIDPEIALRGALKKYIARYERLERAVSRAGKTLSTMTAEEKDEIWSQIKKAQED